VQEADKSGRVAFLLVALAEGLAASIHTILHIAGMYPIVTFPPPKTAQYLSDQVTGWPITALLCPPHAVSNQ
jgi:hypothetical protein